jgi:hypothetical protein
MLGVHNKSACWVPRSVGIIVELNLPKCVAIRFPARIRADAGGDLQWQRH